MTASGGEQGCTCKEDSPCDLRSAPSHNYPAKTAPHPLPKPQFLAVIPSVGGEECPDLGQQDFSRGRVYAKPHSTKQSVNDETHH